MPFLGVLGFLCISSLFLFIEFIPGHKELDQFLMKRLTRVQPPSIISRKVTSESGKVMYVLGGAQNSLIARFQIAAELYHSGLCDKILLLSVPGITEYDQLLERNLTKDEWAVNKLGSFGVKKVDIELASFRKGFFGTLTEAEGLADLAARRDYRHMTLVTSQYHTARTWLTFSTVMKKQEVTLSICGSAEDAELIGHLYEYFKLVFYQNLVLPLYSSQLLESTFGSAESSAARGVSRMNGKYVS